jgi:hypothetical protein
MTFIGKLFVIVNVTLSLVLAGLAFALYMTGIDWSDNPAKGAKPEGETLVLRKQLEKEMGQLGFKGLLQGGEKSQKAARSWEAARVGLWEAEEYRRKLRPEYAKRLQSLIMSKGPGNPQEVELVGHLPAMDKTGFPKMKDAEHHDKPLLPKATYFTNIGQKRTEALELDQKLTRHYKTDLGHTNKIVGDKDLKGADPGLLALLARERDKREWLDEEMRLVESQDVNTRIDGSAVERSYGSVVERIQELEAFLAKRGVKFTRWKEKKKD